MSPHRLDVKRLHTSTESVLTLPKQLTHLWLGITSDPSTTKALNPGIEQLQHHCPRLGYLCKLPGDRVEHWNNILDYFDIETYTITDITIC